MVPVSEMGVCACELIAAPFSVIFRPSPVYAVASLVELNLVAQTQTDEVREAARLDVGSHRPRSRYVAH